MVVFFWFEEYDVFTISGFECICIN